MTKPKVLQGVFIIIDGKTKYDDLDQFAIGYAYIHQDSYMLRTGSSVLSVKSDHDDFISEACEHLETIFKEHEFKSGTNIFCPTVIPNENPLIHEKDKRCFAALEEFSNRHKHRLYRFCFEKFIRYLALHKNNTVKWHQPQNYPHKIAIAMAYGVNIKFYDLDMRRRKEYALSKKTEKPPS